MSGKLYVVGTPIGNLSDLSPRGLETLNTVDFIAAEDTLVTLKLMNRFEIKKPTVSYHEHNMRDSGARIIDRILSGENCAVVSDAGMPAISDPGEDLVRFCHERSVRVYLTLNTLISDNEMEEAEELISFCGEIGIDAFIIQDLSLVQRIKKLAPAAHLHA